MRKKVEGKEVYRNYGLVVIAFLVVMTVSILIFFGVIRENVKLEEQEISMADFEKLFQK